MAVDRELERRVGWVLHDVDDLKKYEFTVVQIKEEVERETVADIFVRINGEARPYSIRLHPYLAQCFLGGRT